MFRILSKLGKRFSFTINRRNYYVFNNKLLDKNIAKNLLFVGSCGISAYYLNKKLQKYYRDRKLCKLLFKNHTKYYNSILREIYILEVVYPELGKQLKNSFNNHLQLCDIKLDNLDTINIKDNTEFTLCKNLEKKYNIYLNPEKYNLENSEINSIYSSLTKIMYFNKELFESLNLINEINNDVEKYYPTLEKFNEIVLRKHLEINNKYRNKSSSSLVPSNSSPKFYYL